MDSISKYHQSPSSSSSSSLIILLLGVLLVNTVDVVNGQSQQGYRKCIDMKNEMMAYTTTGGDFNDDRSNHLLCECRGVSNDGDYMGLCSLYNDWKWCVPGDDPTNTETDPYCASILFGQVFDPNGFVERSFRNYDQIGDKKGTVTVTRYASTNTCEVAVNNQNCRSCEILDNCPVNSKLNQQLYERGIPMNSEELGLFTDLKVNCTNINLLATFECGIADGEGNLLSVLNGEPIPPEDLEGMTFPPRKTPAPQTIDPALFPPTITPVAPPSESIVPSMSPSESMVPTTTKVSEGPSMEPSVSLGPSVSLEPTQQPTVTARPTITAQPTDAPSMSPTEPVLKAETVTTVTAGGAASSKIVTTVLVIISASIFLVL